MYSSLVYEDAVFYSIASFPGMKKRTLIVSGFSKTYAMTGWRVGYLLAESLTLPETGQAAAEMLEEFAAPQAHSGRSVADGRLVLCRS